MAEALKKRRKQQRNETTRSKTTKSKTTSRKPNRKSSGATKKQPVAGDQDAGGRLRAAIDKEVAARSRMIAKAMVDRTIDGNAGVARLLVDFTGAKKRQKPPAEKPSTPTWAQYRASEPPWPGDADPDDNIGSGGREPEV